MTVTSPAFRLPWYFAPTVVIVAGCLVAIVNFGVRSSFGLFTAPISDAYAWPREIYSLSMAIQNLVWGLATPVAGAFADRYGSAKVLMTGAIIYTIGTVMMAYADAPALMHISGGLLVGAGVAASSFSIVMAALGRIVPPEKRSWAFGIATASGSLGQFIFAPLAAALMAAYGWQMALVILGVCALLIVPLAVPLLVQRPDPGRPAQTETDLPMRNAIRAAFGHGSYNLLVAGFFVCGFQLAFVVVHLPPYLAEHGISKEFAGLAMGAIGLFNVVGAYSAGVIGGKYQKRVPLSIIYVLRGLSIAAFVLLPISPVTTLIFTASLGLLWLSTVPLTMGLVVTMFGTRYMATLYGFVFISHQVGSFLGIWIGGKVYDHVGTYDPVWWMGVALSLFAALVNLPIRETRAPAFAAA
jgi:predicted MFS family arabinose efflux permease